MSTAEIISIFPIELFTSDNAAKAEEWAKEKECNAGNKGSRNHYSQLLAKRIECHIKEFTRDKDSYKIYNFTPNGEPPILFVLGRTSIVFLYITAHEIDQLKGVEGLARKKDEQKNLLLKNNSMGSSEELEELKRDFDKLIQGEHKCRQDPMDWYKHIKLKYGFSFYHFEHDRSWPYYPQEERFKSTKDYWESIEEYWKSSEEHLRFSKRYRGLSEEYWKSSEEHLRFSKRYRGLSEEYWGLSEEYRQLKEGYPQLRKEYWWFTKKYLELAEEYPELLARYPGLMEKYLDSIKTHPELEKEYRGLKEQYSDLQKKYPKPKREYSKLLEEYPELLEDYWNFNEAYWNFNEAYWNSEKHKFVQTLLFKVPVGDTFSKINNSEFKLNDCDINIKSNVYANRSTLCLFTIKGDDSKNQDTLDKIISLEVIVQIIWNRCSQMSDLIRAMMGKTEPKEEELENEKKKLEKKEEKLENEEKKLEKKEEKLENKKEKLKNEKKELEKKELKKKKKKLKNEKKELKKKKKKLKNEKKELKEEKAKKKDEEAKKEELYDELQYAAIEANFLLAPKTPSREAGILTKMVETSHIEEESKRLEKSFQILTDRKNREHRIRDDRRKNKSDVFTVTSLCIVIIITVFVVTPEKLGESNLSWFIFISILGLVALYILWPFILLCANKYRSRKHKKY